MYVLQGVVGSTPHDLLRNTEFFAGYQLQMDVTSDRYILDTLIIEPIAGNNISLLEFGKENRGVNNRNVARNNNPAEQGEADSAMNE